MQSHLGMKCYGTEVRGALGSALAQPGKQLARKKTLNTEGLQEGDQLFYPLLFSGFCVANNSFHKLKPSALGKILIFFFFLII